MLTAGVSVHIGQYKKQKFHFVQLTQIIEPIPMNKLSCLLLANV